MQTNQHITASGGNTFGTTFDLIARPSVDIDPRCNEIIQRVIESVMVGFPAEAQQAIEDAVVAAIADTSGRFATLNLNKISTDPNNLADVGKDGGIWVENRFSSGTTGAQAGVAGNFSLPIPWNDIRYIVSVEPTADPGAFRWWVIERGQNTLVVGFVAANNCSLNVYAKG